MNHTPTTIALVIMVIALAGLGAVPTITLTWGY